MNKKIFIFLSIAILVVAIIIAGGYYFYKNPIDSDYQNNNTSQKTDEPINEECEGDQCITVTEANEVIDGVFQKIEDGLLYFQAKDSDTVQSIKMLENAAFSEVTLSESYENMGEKNINLTDFSNGNSISVFVSSNSLGEETVSKLIRIVVLGENN